MYQVIKSWVEFHQFFEEIIGEFEDIREANKCCDFHHLQIPAKKRLHGLAGCYVKEVKEQEK